MEDLEIELDKILEKYSILKNNQIKTVVTQCQKIF